MDRVVLSVWQTVSLEASNEGFFRGWGSRVGKDDGGMHGRWLALGLELTLGDALTGGLLRKPAAGTSDLVTLGVDTPALPSRSVALPREELALLITLRTVGSEKCRGGLKPELTCCLGTRDLKAITLRSAVDAGAINLTAGRV